VVEGKNGLALSIALKGWRGERRAMFELGPWTLAFFARLLFNLYPLPSIV